MPTRRPRTEGRHRLRCQKRDQRIDAEGSPPKNLAQAVLFQLHGMDPEHPGNLYVAAEQVQSRLMAPRGTPPRPKRRISSVLAPRLYKGHRP